MTPPTNSQQKAIPPFSHELRVRYAEVDAQAVVYNSHYVTYFDIAITEFMRALRFDYSVTAARARGKDFHTVRTVVDYRSPAYYDDLLQIAVGIQRIGRSSIAWALTIVRSATDERIADGEVVWVYTDMEKHRSTPLPEELVHELEPHVTGE